MKTREISIKKRRIARKTMDSGIGIIGLVLTAGIIFTILLMNSSDASATPAPDSTAKTVDANAAANAQINSIMGAMTPKQRNALRKVTAERLKEAVGVQAIIQPQLQTGNDGFLIPDYFGPYPNYANSPLPTFTINGVTVQSAGTGYSQNTTVTIMGGDGSGASATPVLDSNGNITSITLSPTSVPGYTYVPTVTIA